MDEATLRDLLARATATEPPIGALARNFEKRRTELLRARVERRRRRAQGTAACAAAVAVLCATVPTLTGPPGPAGGGRRSHQPTLYVADQGSPGLRISGLVTPISIATNRPGKPVRFGRHKVFPMAIAATPDGKTVYVASVAVPGRPGTVTPVATATNRAGRPIRVGVDPIAMAVSPDGATCYVLNLVSDTVTPIATATNRAGRPIRVGTAPDEVLLVAAEGCPSAAIRIIDQRSAQQVYP